MTAATDKDELLTVREAADRYKLHVETIRKWIRCGVLPAVYVGPSKEIRVRENDLISPSDDDDSS